MITYEFPANTDVHAPGPNAGAKFVAWVWHSRLHSPESVTQDVFLHALNQELITYEACALPWSHNAVQMGFQFMDADGHMKFMLTWQGT